MLSASCYSPFERDFALNLGANLGKNYEAIHGVPHADPAIRVKRKPEKSLPADSGARAKHLLSN